MTTPLNTQPYKGTRDFYPPEMRLRRWMFQKLRRTLMSFGYEEYDGPMLEPFELYAAKTSEEIVNEQLYWLIDRGNRKLAIRPEMTPTLARMIAAKQNDLAKPIRWFSIPNLWRYERPQRGRLREHWQLNVDTFGGDALAEDLEICQVIVALMESFGAKTGFEIRLNHRELSNMIFEKALKLKPEQIGVVAKLLDAAPKMSLEQFQSALQELNLDSQQIQFLLNLLNPDSMHLLQEHFALSAGYQHLQITLKWLSALGISKYFRFDPSVMRGFLYYTGMVLEVYDLHPENNRALFGGGRYDNLIALFGNKPLPGVGFGMGDVTLLHFLELHNLLPSLDTQCGLYVAHLNQIEFIEAQILARALRLEFCHSAREIPVLTALTPEKPKKIFTIAEKLGARAVVFVGPDDVKTNRYPMKDLVHGQQALGTAAELARAYLDLP